MAQSLVQIDIFNDKGFEQAVGRLKKGVARKVFRKALRESGRIIQRDAKALAPKDTGLLRKQIKVRAGKRSRKHVNMHVFHKHHPDFVSRRKGTEGLSDSGFAKARRKARKKGGKDNQWYYPTAVEFGHPAPSRTHAGPKSHLQASWDKNIGAVRRRLTRRIRAGILRAVADSSNHAKKQNHLLGHLFR